MSKMDIGQCICANKLNPKLNLDTEGTNQDMFHSWFVTFVLETIIQVKYQR